MSITPEDLQLSGTDHSCTRCQKKMGLNDKAITYHYYGPVPSPSLILCHGCALETIMSLVQDFNRASDGSEWWYNKHYSEILARYAECADDLATGLRLWSGSLPTWKQRKEYKNA